METFEHNTPMSLAFLVGMKPAGPWHLVAIAYGGMVQAATFHNNEKYRMETWIEERQDEDNLYFHVNEPSRWNVKATKRDIESVLAFHVDVDDPQEFALLDAFPLKPTATISSGNGRQAFWVLRQPLADIELAERINRAIADRCGGDNCHNVDRIMRLPGSVNIPNAAKEARGRKRVTACILEADWERVYGFEDFLPFDPGPLAPASSLTLPAHVAPVGLDALPSAVLPSTLALIKHGDDLLQPRGGADPHFKSRSEAAFRVACDLARAGCSIELIAGVLLNPAFGISESILEKRRPEAYALKQARSATAAEQVGWPDGDKAGNPRATMRNARLALQRLGLTFAYDMFRHRKVIGGHLLEEYVGEISDDAAMKLRGIIMDEFGFDPRSDHVQDAIVLLCLEEPLHPVREMLDALSWDGKPRLDEWLSRYMGSANTELNRAIGAIMLIAAVRRVRQPGVKFDQVVIFEGDQGTGKSTAVKILAGEEFHSDQEIMSLDPKAQLELLGGVWIYEIGEVEGMNKAEVNKIKAFVSRQVDRARLPYARHPVARARQVIFIGTTNDDKYLRDQTGNRRFWPVRTGVIDLEGLRADRDQLMAEAAFRESADEPIALPERLWAVAAMEQAERVEDDPWIDQIEGAAPEIIGDMLRLYTTDLLSSTLGIPSERQNQAHTKRLSSLMRKLGWRGGKFNAKGKTVRGYEKPKPADYQPPKKKQSIS
ncbi:VapE domain-containing protein [Bosea sp. AAP35]|uniref:VapE domain-containing protein n=1 Tax=Bosea sp. AAP35 TaxID=1523417 RepID=UPI0006B8A4F6|nr:VapE domain-containing protein [Bosea sp. AAP35]